MSTDFIVLSGAYVGPELAAEFGRLPPAFIPLGGQRLYERQFSLGEMIDARLSITLPSDFEILDADQKALAARHIGVVRLDADLSLARALSEALAQIAPKGRIVLLFGDTLVKMGGLKGSNMFAVGSTRHFAQWAEFVVEDGVPEFRHVYLNEGERDVVAGLFDLRDGPAFQVHLEQTNDFYGALSKYAADHGLRPEQAALWQDFGHLHTCYQSRCNDLSARAFNRISSDGTAIAKTGEPSQKIAAEAQWFAALPPRMKVYTPLLLAESSEPQHSYELEYLYLPTLSELAVYGLLPRNVWRGILEGCRNFLEACLTHRPGQELDAGYHRRVFDSLFREKTLERLQTFAAVEGLTMNSDWLFEGRATPSLAEMTRILIEQISPTTQDGLSLWHGDFHFANIFYDFRSQRIKTIDPRGMLPDGSISLYGDPRYDIAKLSHSVIGLYDFILAGRYALEYDGNRSIGVVFDVPDSFQTLTQDYMSMSIGGRRTADQSNLAMTALLFLSMLPLHSDRRDRQYVMLANAFRLFHSMEQTN